LGLGACAVGTALAQTAGSSAPGNGGAAFVATPKIKAVKCLSSCMRNGSVQGGGRIKLRGTRLAGVKKVVFQGGRGRRDDVTVAAKASSDSALPVPVPMRAQSGPLDVWAGKHAHVRTRTAVKVMPPAAPTPNAQLSRATGPAEAGAPTLETATSRSLFALDQRGGVTFAFRVGGVPATAVELSLVRLDDGSAVKTFAPWVPASGQVGTVSWDGMVDGREAPDGRYAFRLTAVAGGGAKALNAAPGDLQRDAFDLRPALFPVRGRHNLGQGEARFGAVRSGHRHQGQDVMAACGTPLIAARGGVVKAKKFEGSAGNYVVIGGAGTGVDYGYMHLAAPSAYEVGDRVHTGDQIGVVGQTGDANVCHLHFEEWKPPGWYSGGSPFDPLPDLKLWDSWS
jgi:murein DD-endopeptidase MepM/ murein hydrolase activator NlpD